MPSSTQCACSRSPLFSNAGQHTHAKPLWLTKISFEPICHSTESRPHFFNSKLAHLAQQNHRYVLHEQRRWILLTKIKRGFKLMQRLSYYSLVGLFVLAGCANGSDFGSDGKSTASVNAEPAA